MIAVLYTMTSHSPDIARETFLQGGISYERAIEIAQKLSDNNRWKSHGRPIGIRTLTDELHLRIIDFEKDTELNSLISEYYDVMSEYIAGHNYRIFFQTRLFL